MQSSVAHFVEIPWSRKLVLAFVAVGIMLSCRTSLAGCLKRVDSETLKSCSGKMKILVGVTPGGASDVFAREFSEFLNTTEGIVSFVENKAGASGHISVQVLKGSFDFDCVSMMGTASSLYLNTFNPALKPPLDPKADFASIGLVATNPMFLLINTDQIPVKTLSEFVDWASSHPTFFATPGVGTSNHLMARRMVQVRSHFGDGKRMDATHVPTNGASEAMRLLISGSVGFTFENPATARLANGHPNLKVVAATSASSSTLDGIEVRPLASDPRLAGATGESAFGLVGNKKMSLKMQRAMDAALSCFVQDPRQRRKYEEQSYVVSNADTSEMELWIDTQLKSWAPYAERAFD